MDTPFALSHAPFLRGPGDPGRVAVLDVTIHVLVRGEDTEGGWALVDYTMPGGFPGPPAHVHDLATEAFYGLEGVTTLEVGDRTIRLHAGEVAVVPPGVVHRFRNADAGPARHLVLLTPAGFERYFDELAALAAAEGQWPPRDPERLRTLVARHDLRMV